ncbi:Hint domain-containing protein [Nioella sediminis]|jgi:hypothetical protein|uniref:Hint domain-containing protein n=2 Tax=Nioella sediminis TaxID=1912092 RepID=UPI0009F80811|nr:Hint domain-containing protein [Nioella sediminis]
MATYDITHTVAYDYGSPAGSNGSVLLPAQNIIAELNDLQADMEFTVGNSVQLSGVTYTYVGQVMIDGQSWPIFDYVDTNPFQFRVVMMDQAPVSPPATLTPGDISTAAFPTCFVEGTLINSPGGERAVESIKIGDRVLSSDGSAVPVKWIGRQTVSTRFGPAERLMPVRFATGSLGNGLPHTDLMVTADHGMLVDGVVCHAGALVNDTTITRVPLSEMGETYTVYHIETEEHEIILANGAPAETFIDNVSRRVFDNYSEFDALYGEVPEMEELPYPRAMSARQVPTAIRARLAGKAAA